MLRRYSSSALTYSWRDLSYYCQIELRLDSLISRDSKSEEDKSQISSKLGTSLSIQNRYNRTASSQQSNHRQQYILSAAFLLGKSGFTVQFNMQAKWGDALQLGTLTLKNRIFMAPLARQRCDPATGVPTELHAEYYQQRATAGLIFTEGTAWSPRGRGFIGGAELFNQHHVQGWKKVVQRVHQKGGKIIVQLVHCGRVSHQTKTKGLKLWAPSPLPLRGEVMNELEGAIFPIPKQMTEEDIAEVCDEFEASVEKAKRANFDGIQIHGAQGYLVDSFLRSGMNIRKDAYGGSPANRCRFALQLIDRAVKYFPSSQVGLKISPVSRLKDSFDQNPHQTFKYLLQALSARGVGFIQVRQSTEKSIYPNLYGITPKEQMEDVCKVLRPYFNGLLIANDSFRPDTGLAKIQAGLCDAISFGRLYIVNPDLVQRILNGYPLSKNWEYALYYGHHLGSKGYTDYPTYKQ